MRGTASQFRSSVGWDRVPPSPSPRRKPRFTHDGGAPKQRGLCLAPSGGVQPFGDQPLQARPGPVPGSLHQSVLHRVVVHVTRVPSVVLFVPDDVLPETPLPQCRLALARPRSAPCPLRPSTRQVALREHALDRGPPPREVEVPLRQGTDRVEVVRKQTHGIHVEGPAAARIPPGRTQTAASRLVGQKRPPLVGHDREEVGAAHLAPRRYSGMATDVSCEVAFRGVRPVPVVRRSRVVGQGPTLRLVTSSPPAPPPPTPPPPAPASPAGSPSSPGSTGTGPPG